MRYLTGTAFVILAVVLGSGWVSSQVARVNGRNPWVGFLFGVIAPVVSIGALLWVGPKSSKNVRVS